MRKKGEKKKVKVNRLQLLSTFHIFMNLSMIFLNHEAEEIVIL